MILEDFIGIFPNTLTPEECQDYVNYFHKLDSMGLLYHRTDPSHIKKDKAYNIIGKQFHGKETSGKLVVQHIYPRLINNYKIYAKHYSVLQDYSHHDIYDINQFVRLFFQISVCVFIIIQGVSITDLVDYYLFEQLCSFFLGV